MDDETVKNKPFKPGIVFIVVGLVFLLIIVAVIIFIMFRNIDNDSEDSDNKFLKKSLLYCPDTTLEQGIENANRDGTSAEFVDEGNILKVVVHYPNETLTGEIIIDEGKISFEYVQISSLGISTNEDKYINTLNETLCRDKSTSKKTLYKVNIDTINYFPAIFGITTLPIYMYQDGDLNLSFSLNNFSISNSYNYCSPASGTVRTIGHIYTHANSGYCLYSYDGKQLKIYWKFTVTPGNWDYERTEMITGTFDKQYKTLTLDLGDVSYHDTDKYILNNTAYSYIINKLKERNIDSLYVYYDKDNNKLYDTNGLSLICNDQDIVCDQIILSEANIKDFEDNTSIPIVDDELEDVETLYKSMMGKCYIAEDVGYWHEKGYNDFDLVYCFGKKNMYKATGEVDLVLTTKRNIDVEKKGNDLYINNKKVTIVHNDGKVPLFTIDDVVFEYYYMSDYYDTDF